MDKKTLLVTAISADPAFVTEVSDNCFDTFITRLGKDGEETVVTAEYRVWTVEEAEAEGYTAGGIDTADPTLKAYRIF
ncbi:hypothetical protein [Zavarzinella formosa]|uniref:hypothetical protein n=1 Tax=Zavarzinella formosa TaxID=360055 RepID=UPI0002DDE5FE|nr:hypothetical protein [Zavarzinella formosa]